MNFDEFKAVFIKENRKLRIMMGFSSMLFAGMLFLLVFQKNYFVYQGHSIFEERVLSEKICLAGFKSIVNGLPDSALVAEGIVEILENEPFEMPITKVLKLKSIEEGFCNLVIDSNSKLLAFRIGLHGDDSNPFYYKILSIDELPVKE